MDRKRREQELMAIDQLELIAELYGLRRDLVSDGYDQALGRLCADFPITVHEFASGTQCWTWTVPPKWSCTEAFVEDSKGHRVIDLAEHPLHVASYSQPVDRRVGREELLEHLHVHPHMPEHPPFIFHYYQPDWSFCCGAHVRSSLEDDWYSVLIRSNFQQGTLKVGEWVLPGRTEESFVFCAHLDHPCQINDGLSGVATALAVMDELSRGKTSHYTYRLLIVPETIGSVCWLSRHEDLIPRLIGGLFVEMTGLRQPPALQHSFCGNTWLDRCLARVHMASESGSYCGAYRALVGNDERQFNAPGVRVPMLSYSRSLRWEHPRRPFPEYHSAADNLDVTDADALDCSRRNIVAMVEALEDTKYPHNLFKGEAFLAGAGLAADRHHDLHVHRDRLKIMDYIDGCHSVADIAEALELDAAHVKKFVDDLTAAGLVRGGHAGRLTL